MVLPKALYSPILASYFLVVACCPMPVWMNLPLPLHLPLNNVRLHLYSISVDFCYKYQTCYPLNLCTSTVIDLVFSIGLKITSGLKIYAGAPNLLFGSAPFLSYSCTRTLHAAPVFHVYSGFSYLYLACRTVMYLLFRLLGFYVKLRSHEQRDFLKCLNS